MYAVQCTGVLLWKSCLWVILLDVVFPRPILILCQQGGWGPTEVPLLGYGPTKALVLACVMEWCCRVCYGVGSTQGWGLGVTMYAYQLHKGWPRTSFSPLPFNSWLDNLCHCPPNISISIASYHPDINLYSKLFSSIPVRQPTKLLVKVARHWPRQQDQHDHDCGAINAMQNFHVIRRNSSKYCPCHHSTKSANVSAIPATNIFK